MPRDLRYLVATVMSCLFIVACRNDPPVSGGIGDVQRSDIRVVQVDLIAASEFPLGFKPEFDYVIRSRRIDGAGEDVRRAVVIEFSGESINSVDASIRAGLERIGYKRYRWNATPQSGLAADYGRDGERVHVAINPLRPGMKVMNPASRGTVYFVWNYRPRAAVH